MGQTIYLNPMNKTKSKWKDLGDNQILEGKGFFISYNPDTSSSKMGLGELYNKLGAFYGSMLGEKIEDDGRAETALVNKKIFYILNGDFRKEYEIISKGFNKCLEFYKSKPELHSGWSTKI